MYKYKAFISYRHIPFDSYIAEKLLKLIETYKKPHNISQDKRKEYWKCFRDEEEIPISSDIGKEIHYALENSEYLIVVCSPELLESKWCLEEISYFKKIHGGSTDNIIAVLIDGKSETAFPESLTSTIIDGKECEVEPLAAEIKGNSVKDSLKKLKTKYLKIVARFLDCEYDDLIQRENRRKRKKLILFSCIAIAVLTVIIIIISISFTTVNNKNKTISQQYNELEEKNNKITEQNSILAENKIEMDNQNKNLLIENSHHLISESNVLFENGDLFGSIKKSVEALPKEYDERPLVSEAVNNLAQKINAYDYISMVPENAFIHKNDVSEILYLDDDMVVTHADNVFFWNRKTGELVREEKMDEIRSFICKNTEYDITKSDIITTVTPTSKKGYQNFQVRNEVEQMTCNALIKHNYLENKDRILIISHSDGGMSDLNTIIAIDCHTGKTLWETKGDGLVAVMNDNVYLYSRKKSYYKQSNNIINYHRYISDIAIVDKFTGEHKGTIDVSDLNVNGEVESVIHVSESESIVLYTDPNHFDLQSAFISDGRAIRQFAFSRIGRTHFNKYYIAEGIIYFFEYVGEPTAAGVHSMGNGIYNAYAYDLNNNLYKKWGITFGSDLISEAAYFSAEKADNFTDIICAVSSKNVRVLNAWNGNELHTYSFESNIVDTKCSDNGYMTLVLEDGSSTVLKLNGLSQDTVVYTGYIPVLNPSPLSAIAYKDHGDSCAVVSKDTGDKKTLFTFVKQHNSDFISVYPTKSGKVFTKVNNLSPDKQWTIANMPDEEDTLSWYYGNGLCLYNINSKQTINIDDEFANQSIFLDFWDNDHIYYYDEYKKTIGIYDFKELKSISIELEDDVGDLQMVNGKLIGSGYEIDVNGNIERYTWKRESNSAYNNYEYYVCSDRSIIVVTDETINFYKEDGITLIKQISLREIPAGVKTVFYADEQYIWISLSDGGIYVVNSETAEILAYYEKDYMSTVSLEIVSDELCILKLNDQLDTKAYFIDLSDLTIINEIQGFVAYYKDENKILVKPIDYDDIGFYPFYTSDELIEKAKAFFIDINIPQITKRVGSRIQL